MKKTVIILLHSVYWLMFLFLLLSFFIIAIPALDSHHKMPGMRLFARWTALMTGFAIVPGIISFYTFYFFLSDQFLKKGKIGLLLLWGLGTAISAAAVGGMALSFVLFKPGFMFNGGMESAATEIILMTFGALINGTIGLVMRGFINWYGDIELKAALAQKNHEMELAIVKLQLNPHFLFNTINNIDVLIAKNPVQASLYLNKLSDIMRFMLYETKTEEIPLAKEVLFIEKYIALQRIRTSNVKYVQYKLTGDTSNRSIAPMLFIPFVENAFKHGGHRKIDNAIVINLLIEQDGYTFECENLYTIGTGQTLADGGLGNELIQKRLRLLYPGRHILKISHESSLYKVKLVIYHHAH